MLARDEEPSEEPLMKKLCAFPPQGPRSKLKFLGHYMIPQKVPAPMLDFP